MSDLQLFPALDAATEAALRASIVRFGVLVPVFRDQDGRTLDGHQRARIADELGAPYEVIVLTVADDEEARELAVTLNADRRQLSPEQHAAVVADLRGHGHSIRAIAGAVGTSKSEVAREIAQLSRMGQLTAPDRVTGRDGRSRLATRPHRAPRSLPPAPGHGETPAVTEARRRFEAEVEAAGGPETDEGQRLLENAEQEQARLATEIVAHEPPVELGTGAPFWPQLLAIRDAIRELSTISPDLLASNVPTRRRAQFAKDLRRYGLVLGAVAARLEDME